MTAVSLPAHDDGARETLPVLMSVPLRPAWRTVAGKSMSQQITPDTLAEGVWNVRNTPSPRSVPSN